jgi:hypothetical protein
MADRSPHPDAPHPDDIRQSLRALADGSAPPREPPDEPAPPDGSAADPEPIVRDAERAVGCAREAASFLSAGRLSDLDRAVATATRRGDDTVAARGRVAREPLRRLDAALSGSEQAKPPDGPAPAADPRSRTTSTPVAERF